MQWKYTGLVWLRNCKFQSAKRNAKSQHCSACLQCVYCQRLNMELFRYLISEPSQLYPTCLSGHVINITQYPGSLLLPLTIYPRFSLCSRQTQSYTLPKILPWISSLYLCRHYPSTTDHSEDNVIYLCHCQFVGVSVFFCFYWTYYSPLLKRTKK